MTNPVYSYKIYKSIQENFQQSVQDLLQMVDKCSNRLPVKFVFFGNPSSNEEYVYQSSIIARAVEQIYVNEIPACGYVSQPPLDSDLILEVTYLDNYNDFKTSYNETDGIDYVVVKNDVYEELIVGGVIDNPVDNTIRTQCKNVYLTVSNILAKENFMGSDIVRQWNYIERITAFEGEYQHYQCFNDVRTYFYSKYKWDNGYPAATGIGTTLGGIMIEFNAIKSSDTTIVPLDNKLQIPAHEYSQKVLLGVEDKYLKEKTTPKFERGKAVFNDDFKMSYISGTAAIRGEMSQVSDSVLIQTKTTLSNIDYLVSPQNLEAFGIIGCPNEVEYRLLRAYIKNEEDIDVVKKYMGDKYISTEISYLYADVCREELLIEIEGIALYK